MEGQESQSELSPEEAKASLGLSTRLSESLLQTQSGAKDEQSTDASQPPETPPQSEVPTQTQESPTPPTEDPRIAQMATDIELLKKLVLKNADGN